MSAASILVSGMVASVPRHGGATWAVLQYLLGLKRLGYTVHFVEPVDESALLPHGASLERSENAAYFRRTMKDFGLEGNSSLLLANTRRTVGLAYDRLRKTASRADMLLNISGLLADDALTGNIPLRIYLDLDPAFTQLWHAAEGIGMGFSSHNRFATVGQSIGEPECPVPTCGRRWIPTPQPVVLSEWPVSGRVVHGAFTTVANWRGYGSLEHEGVFFGQKAHSLRQFIALPALTKEKLMPAIAIHPDEKEDLSSLKENGWRILDPAHVADTPDEYRRFIRGSKAEFAIAKSGYVASRCGWFSDRSICYLASGKPVLAQNTGFKEFLPVGEGLLAFETMDEALSGIEEISGGYERHCRAARSLTEAYFDSDEVLGSLLGKVDTTYARRRE